MVSHRWVCSLCVKFGQGKIRFTAHSSRYVRIFLFAFTTLYVYNIAVELFSFIALKLSASFLSRDEKSKNKSRLMLRTKLLYATL